MIGCKVVNYILGDDGTVLEETDTIRWAEWFERNKDRRRVGHTEVGDYFVSTVFLGLDHNYSRLGPPLVFETMVFEKKVSRSKEIELDGHKLPAFDYHEEAGFQERCSTWEQALAMHQRGVEFASALKGALDTNEESI